MGVIYWRKITLSFVYVKKNRNVGNVEWCIAGGLIYDFLGFKHSRMVEHTRCKGNYLNENFRYGFMSTQFMVAEFKLNIKKPYCFLYKAFLNFAFYKNY